jgi:phosphoribosylglycinamide formyltransferase-1
MEPRSIFRLGILGSGKGSNMAAIAEACQAGRYPMEVAVVISDVADAGILDRARTLGLEARFIPPGKYRAKLDEDAEEQTVQTLREAKADAVVLAGFMRILKGNFLKAFRDRVVNIHPSLLPSFPGLEAWKQALDYGVRVTGCSIHLVDEGIDSGPILAQQTVPVLDGDTAATLHERIQRVERVLYPATVGAWLSGELQPRRRKRSGPVA